MKRFILLGAMVFAIVIVLIGNYTWNQKIDETVTEAEEKIQEKTGKEAPAQKIEPVEEEGNETDEVVETSTEEQPRVEIEPEEQVAAENVEKTESTPKKEAPAATPKDANNDNKADTSKPEEKPSLEEIKSAYYALFQELEVQETSRVDQLMVEAKADLISSNAPLSELMGKYQEIANAMLQNSDQAFDLIYKELEYDLERNGYSVTEAEEFRAIYNVKKQERLERIKSQLQEL